MSLFFIVSGVVVRKHQTTKYDLQHYEDFIFKNFFALLIPYFIWGIKFVVLLYKTKRKAFIQRLFS